MKLGIMQPYFVPYIGYFDLIRRSDRWIVFDTAQYIRHGWVNRNRILHPTAGWQYIIVPLKKHAQDAAISEVEPASDQPWQKKILGQLQHYRRTAPFYKEVIELLTNAFAAEGGNLARLNVSLLRASCARLGIPFNVQMFSEMNLKLPSIDAPGDWALEISAALGASEYINPPGGAALFDREAFAQRGIKLTIQKIAPFTYPTANYKFEEALSIVDVMMWNSPEAIREYLDAQTDAD